jgi:trans-aconitate 2-methyltransferase
MSDPSSSSAVDYAYGDNVSALARLKVVASVFRPATESLLIQLASEDPGVILDLGCGPGQTTRLLHQCFSRASIVGLDASKAFIAAARERAPRQLSFIIHDVGTLPLAGAPAGLIYARLLLAHLPQPASTVAKWVTQLDPNGLLVLEEVERIETEDTLFRRYLDIATAVLRARGTELYIGPALTRMPTPRETRIEKDSTVTLSPAIRDAASMFALNLETLRHDQVVRKRISQEELDEISKTLRTRAQDGTGLPVIWEIRQQAIRSTGR